MLHKPTSFLAVVKGLIFIPLASILIFVFACSQSDENNDTVELLTEQNAPSQSVQEELFFVVEDMPTFKGASQLGLVTTQPGLTSFQEYIYNNVKYPQEAQEQRIQGKVMVQFVVNTEGYVDRTEIVKSVHPLLDEEALRVVENSPQWEPGKQRGKKVNVQFTLPIVFSLKE